MRRGRRTQLVIAALGAALVAGAFSPASASPAETEPAPTRDLVGATEPVSTTIIVDDPTVGPVVEVVEDVTDEPVDAVTEVVEGTVGTTPVPHTSPAPATETDSTSDAGMVDGTAPAAPSADAPPSPAVDDPARPITTDAGLETESSGGASDDTPTGVVEALGASVSSFRVPVGLLGLMGLGLIVQSAVLPPDRRLVSARTDRDLRRFR